MNEWKSATLVELCELSSGVTVTAQQLGSGVKYVTVKELYLGKINIEKAPRANLAALEVERYALKPGDIVFGKSSVKLDGIGIPAWFDGSNQAVTFSNFTVRVRMKVEGIHQKYLYYWLAHSETRKWVIAHAQQSALTNLNQSITNSIPVCYPSKVSIQGKIAGILDTIDQTIEKTEALIEKYQHIKAGLMHDLFTRGITADGKLRPPREQAPELYQDTPIGWIPKDWSYSYLSKKSCIGVSHIKTGPFGSALKGEHWVTEGHPVITIGALGEGDFTTSELLYIGDFDAMRLSGFKLKEGDVVFSRVADVGRSVVIEKDQVGWIMSSNLMRISLDRKQVLPNFLQYQLATDMRVKKQIRCKVNAGGREVANSDILNRLVFIWPDPDEQKAIVTRAFVLNIPNLKN